MDDRLAEIKARRAAILQPGAPDEGRPAWNRWAAYAPSDIDWLVAEVERLRRLVNTPLGAIWREVEDATRKEWFGDRKP